MYAARRTQPFRLIGLLTLFCLLSACQKKCQPPAEQKFSTITATQWRLVSSTEPSVRQNLTITTFLLLQFNNNYTGQINKVVNNDLYDNPIQRIDWNADGKGNLRMRFTNITAAADPQAQTQADGTQDAGTYDYKYTLDRELNLYDLQNGYSYRYVPFMGIVEPDRICSF